LLFAFANNFRRSAAVCKIQKAIAPSGLKSRRKNRVYFHGARYKNISQAKTSNANQRHNKKSPFFHYFFAEIFKEGRFSKLENLVQIFLKIFLIENKKY